MRLKRRGLFLSEGRSLAILKDEDTARCSALYENYEANIYKLLSLSLLVKLTNHSADDNVGHSDVIS
jgi:hypothetical protein